MKVVMKKVIFALATTLLLISLASAAIDVNKTAQWDAVISELGNSAKYTFEINNGGPEESFEIYSLLGVDFMPRGAFVLNHSLNKIDVEAYPGSAVRRNTGYYTFEYQIKGQSSGIFKDKMTIKIVSLEEAIKIGSENFKPGDEEIKVTLESTESTNIQNIPVRFKSAFFDFTKEVSLGPLQKINIPIKIDSEKVKDLRAGPYVVTADFNSANGKYRIDGVMNYLEKEGLSVNQTSSGFLIRRNMITKTNEGNVDVTAKIEAKKNLITRLFAVYSVEPTKVDRKGIYTYYTWEKKVSPGESFEVDITTNYTFPFVLIILVIVVAFMAKMYYSTSLTVTKRVSYVKTKGGQFALKVRLFVKANKHVDNIQIIDRIPAATNLYEKFGMKPDKIDHSTRRLFWNVHKLSPGEERVFSYIIYSNMKVFGRFELPSATALYDSDGKKQEAFSNKTSFVTDEFHQED